MKLKPNAPEDGSRLSSLSHSIKLSLSLFSDTLLYVILLTADVTSSCLSCTLASNFHFIRTTFLHTVMRILSNT